MRRLFHALTALFLAIGVVTLIASGARAAAPAPPPYRVIVNAKNPVTRLPRKLVTEAMLKKTTRWSDGSVIKPVDLVPDSSVRRVFSEEVLKRSVESVRAYWQQIVFSGRDVPPPELANDAEVVKFVASHDGALGYVSGAATLDGVKAVVVE